MSRNKKFTRGDVNDEITLLLYKFNESIKAFPFQSLIPKDNTPLAKRFFLNELAQFHTQNFYVRLYSTLQYFGVYENPLHQKSSELIILKRLRNKFGHSLGSFTKTDSDDRNTMRKIIKTFNLPNIVYSDFPIYNEDIINAIINASLKFVNEQFPSEFDLLES